MGRGLLMLSGCALESGVRRGLFSLVGCGNV